MRLPKHLTWAMAQTQWPQTLDPIINNPINQGILIGPVALASGTTAVNHMLGRAPVGWMIADQDAASNIYRSAPFNKLTLDLTSSASCNVKLWVF